MALYLRQNNSRDEMRLMRLAEMVRIISKLILSH